MTIVNWNRFFAIKKNLALIIWLMICGDEINAQDWKFHEGIDFGTNLNFHWGKGQHFPGLRFFASLFITGRFQEHFIVNYGPTISIYTHLLGANLNPLINDLEVDLNNAFSIGYGVQPISYLKYFRTVNNGSFYNIALDQKYALIVSSNFIINSHRRNQIVCSVSGSIGNVTLNYYNDGGWPSLMPFADNFDRWWTGGLAVYGHRKDQYNLVEFSFDQFTGYQPLLFEVTTMLGINIPGYSQDNKEKTPPNYNTSAYNLKIFAGPGYALDIGVIGSLRTNSTGSVFGLQDIIHTIGGFALHPNNDVNRFYLGGTFNKIQYVRL